MMFKVSITETLKRVVEIETTNPEEALFIAREMYENEEVVLDSSDFVSHDIVVTDYE